MSDLARVLLEELAGDPVAVARLRELVGAASVTAEIAAPAFTVATLAGELGRSERSIRAAIARGELPAVKRGRGYVISAEAVAEWARAPVAYTTAADGRRSPRRRRSGAGPAARALRNSR